MSIKIKSNDSLLYSLDFKNITINFRKVGWSGEILSLGIFQMPLDGLSSIFNFMNSRSFLSFTQGYKTSIAPVLMKCILNIHWRVQRGGGGNYLK